MKKALKVEAISQAARKEEEFYKAEIVQIFADMDVIDERIAGNQAETARLQAETRVILAQIQAEMALPNSRPCVKTHG